MYKDVNEYLLIIIAYCFLQSSDGSATAPGGAYPGSVQRSCGQPGSDSVRPRDGRDHVRQHHVAGQPVVAGPFIQKLKLKIQTFKLTSNE